VVKGKDKAFRYLAKKTKNTGKFSWKIPTTNKYPVGSKYKIKVMAFKGGAKINDLSDKTFSIVAASSDDSTGDGSTGGGAGGGNTGGHDGDATEDEPTGPPETDVGGDVESTLRIISPTSGQKYEMGERIQISWAVSGAAADNDVCLLMHGWQTGGGGFVGKVYTPLGWFGGGPVKRGTAHMSNQGNCIGCPPFKGMYRMKLYTVEPGARCRSRLINGGPALKLQRPLWVSSIVDIQAGPVCGDGKKEGDEVCDWLGYTCEGFPSLSERFHGTDGRRIPFYWKARVCNRCASADTVSVVGSPESAGYFLDPTQRRTVGPTPEQEGYRICTNPTE